jgi:hypothetical protein
MRLSFDSVKLGSLGLWPAVLITAAFSLAGSGCVVVSDTNSGPVPGSSGGGSSPNACPSASTTPSQTPDVVAIDTGKTLTSTPGAGAGMYVEYATGGSWNIFTTCDVNATSNPDRSPCEFDAYVTAASTADLGNPVGENLDTSYCAGGTQPQQSIDGTCSYVENLGGGSIHLHTMTGTGTDGMTFTTVPGATIDLQMGLACTIAPQVPQEFLYWIGGGVLHTGAPTDPIDFKPSAP